MINVPIPGINPPKLLHFKLPPVYRYMGEEYIDLFFEKGVLRISSFQKFVDYPDEVRGDPSEGSGSYQARTKEGLQFIAMADPVRNAYILSTSVLANDSLKKEFNENACFKIVDPMRFSAAIIKVLNASVAGYLGFCNYQEYRIVHKKLQDFSDKEFLSDEGSFIFGAGAMKRNAELIGNRIDQMFLKELKYQSQSEFRFVWTINEQIERVQEYLDVQCSEAIQFCERI